jgi:hypothetical protein
MDAINVSAVETSAFSVVNLVEPHDPRDADFYGRWLLKAAEADRVLDTLLRDKPKLRKSFLAVADDRQLRPGCIATNLASRLMGENRLDLSLEAEETAWGGFRICCVGLF